MVNEQTKDQLILDGLLSEIAKRVDGAVDFWTTVCFLDPSVVNRHDWLQKHLDEFRSMVVATRCLWVHQNPTKETWGLLESMVESCNKLHNVFHILERFPTESPESIRLATMELSEIYTHLRETIPKLGNTLGLEVAYLTGNSVEKEAYSQKILAVLFDLFCQKRDTRQPVATSP